MTQETSQAGVRPEGCLASMSRWATTLLVIPLLTGLSFVASTVFACVYGMGGGWRDGWLSSGRLWVVWVAVIFSFIVGVGLGIVLRDTMMRIRDTGRIMEGIWGLVGVGFAWILAFFVQFAYFILVSMFA